MSSGFLIDENVDLIDGGCGDEDYTLSVDNDSEVVVKGGVAAFELTVIPSAGFDGPVSFRVSGLPGTATSFDPPVINCAGTTILTVATSNLTPSGNFPLTITSTSGYSGRFNRVAVTALIVLDDTAVRSTSLK